MKGLVLLMISLYVVAAAANTTLEITDDLDVEQLVSFYPEEIIDDFYKHVRVCANIIHIAELLMKGS